MDVISRTFGTTRKGTGNMKSTFLASTILLSDSLSEDNLSLLVITDCPNDLSLNCLVKF